MKSEILSQERNVVVVKAEFDASEVGRAVGKAVRALSESVNIKGFRKGRVPRKMLELYAGRGAIYRDAAERLAQESLNSIVSEYELRLIAEPKLKLGELVEGSALDLEFTLEVRPEVTLPDLSTLEAERTLFPVTDEQVEEAFNQILESASEFATVEEDRPASAEDCVEVECEVWKARAGEDRELVDEKKKSNINLADENLRKEIKDAVIGKNTGDKFVVEIQAPVSNGQEGEPEVYYYYDLEVLRLTKRVVPEHTDEKIAEITKGKYETAEALRAELRKQMEDTAREKSDATLRESAVKALVKAAEVDVPESMIERQRQAVRRNHEAQVEHDTKMPLDKYLESIDMSREEYDNNQKERAEETVRGALVIETLAEAEDISFTSEQLTMEVYNTAAAMRVNPEALAAALRENEDEFNALTARVRNRNAVDHLITKVQVREVESALSSAGDSDSGAEAEE